MVKDLSFLEILNLGFYLAYPKVFEEGFSYEVYQFKKNDSLMDITIEYNEKNSPKNQYLDFNGETLKGFEKLDTPNKMVAIKMMMLIM